MKIRVMVDCSAYLFHFDSFCIIFFGKGLLSLAIGFIPLISCVIYFQNVKVKQISLIFPNDKLIRLTQKTPEDQWLHFHLRKHTAVKAILLDLKGRVKAP